MFTGFHHITCMHVLSSTNATQIMLHYTPYTIVPQNQMACPLKMSCADYASAGRIGASK